MDIKVSIIIPTYDRPNTLRQVIDSYIKQDSIGEIIIIDDGSEKNYSETNKYIKKLAYNQNINFVYQKNKKNMGASFCRNLGVSLAKCNYILWGEDDAFLSHNYLKILIKKLKSKTILFGSIYYGITPSMEDKEVKSIIMQQQKSEKPIFNTRLFEGYYRKKVNCDIEVPFAHALILVPTEAYRLIKYYENYKVNGYREESDAQVQMTVNGYNIIYTSDAECYHLPGYAIETGGQHKSSRLKQELYTIINTFIFYDRHYSFFKNHYKIETSKVSLKLYFCIHRISENYNRIIRKIRGCIKL